MKLFLKKFNCTLSFLFGIFFFISSFCSGQISKNDAPMIGAEIFIEPGQSDKDVESWFRMLHENNMALTRIRMFENYMKDAKGNWDFSLFDRAFAYAEKYNIKVYGNLFPETSFLDIGGFKFPRDDDHLNRIANYIQAVVTHFSKFKSLYGWVPINEPGSMKANLPHANAMYIQWLKNNKEISQQGDLTHYRHFSFNDKQFLLYYNTWFLEWLVSEIKKYDNRRPIHVNPDVIFRFVSLYDFTAWRKILTSLGGSAHAGWHFDYFTRNDYAIAMSANSEILRSAAGPLPWLMTEIQGGNNIYSAKSPMCPTKEEVAQWLWTTIGTGGKGAIFWCLNPRGAGIEAGEWGLVDFENKPTDRFNEIAKIATIVKENNPLFSKAIPLNSHVHILYNKETLWAEDKLMPSYATKEESRQSGAAMKSSLAYFKALSEMGLQPELNDWSEFDFSRAGYAGKTIILANQIIIPEKNYGQLRDFVKKGGLLIVDGLTSYYNEFAVCKMMDRFPLEDVFGARVKEFRFADTAFPININDSVSINGHFQKGLLKLTTAKPVASEDGKILASVNRFGEGKMLWIPSLVGLEAKITGDYKGLIKMLQHFINLGNEISFEEPASGLMMKKLQVGDKLITILINKNKIRKVVALSNLNRYSNAAILYSNKKSSVNKNSIAIDSEDTVVILWRRSAT